MRHALIVASMAALLTRGGIGFAAGMDDQVQNAAAPIAAKLVRGAVNAVTGIVEWPMQTYKGFARGVGFIKNRPLSAGVGTVLGFFRGIVHAAGRTGSGFTEVVACWLPNPKSNKGVGIPFDGEYAWDMGTAYDIFKPTLAEGLKPYPRKLVRGLGNGFGGIVDVPDQIIKGASSDSPVTGALFGAVKGVWSWMGRGVHGFSEAILFLTPNPEDHLGYPFEQDWFWDDIHQ